MDFVDCNPKNNIIFGLYSQKFADFKILKAYDIKEIAIVTPDNYLDWLI